MHYTIKECDNFLEFLKANFKDSETPKITNLRILINLIEDKKYLSQNNQSLKTIDKKIIKQIEILKLEIVKDFEYIIRLGDSSNQIEKLNEKYKNIDKFKNMNKETLDRNIIQLRNSLLGNDFFYRYEIKRSSDIKINFIAEIILFLTKNKLFSTIVYFMISISGFIGYFLFKIEYVPNITYIELFYIGTLISAFLIFIIFITCILICLLFGSYFQDLDNNVFYKPKMFIFYPRSGFIFFLSWFSVVLMESMIYDMQTFLNSIELFYFIFFLISYLIISILMKYNQNNKNNVFNILELIISLGICTICFISEDNITDKVGIRIIFYITILHFCVLTISNIEQNIKHFKFSVILTVLIIFILSIFLFSEKAIQTLNYGNINYKFIAFDKKYSNLLPEEICDQYQKTYFYINKKCKTADDIKVVSFKNKTIKYTDNNDENESKIIHNAKIECLDFFDSNNTKIEKIYHANRVEFDNNTLKFIMNNERIMIQNAKLKINPKTCTTYKTNQNNITKVHNIKALSIVGKFYLLETMDGKIFEIDSNLIISKEKE